MAQRKVQKSTRVFDGWILSVRVDEVDVGEGVIAPREVVEHKPAVSILPIDGDGNVYLVRQYRHAVGQEMIEAPAGLIEEGETPEQAALRELREETGAIGTVESLGIYVPTPGYCEEIIHLFLARVTSFGETDPDDDEFLQTIKLPFDEFYDQVRDGTLRDGKTIALALRSAPRPNL